MAVNSLFTVFDYASSGQYNIYNCGSDKASQLHGLLDDLYTDLLPAIRDSKRPKPSPAFQTFFKSSSNAPFVTALLTNVTRGTAMTPPLPPYSPNGSPTFFCVDGEDQFVYHSIDPSTGVKRRYDTYTTCIERGNQVASYLGFTPPKQFIVLCPVFWTDHFTDTAPPRTCLSVNTYMNKFREDGERQRLFRTWILLEELAHYYIYTSTLRKDAPDIYDVNKCVRLAAKTAYLNAVSYVYYAASKSFSSAQNILEIHPPRTTR